MLKGIDHWLPNGLTADRQVKNLVTPGQWLFRSNDENQCPDWSTKSSGGSWPTRGRADPKLLAENQPLGLVRQVSPVEIEM